MIPTINDHIEKAKDRLLTQYREKQRVGWVIEAVVNEIQNLENVFALLATDRTLDVSAGVQLDRIGVIVGLSRVPGQSDADYRQALKVKIGQNISEGEPESVIQTFRTLTGATLVILNDGAYAELSLMANLQFTQEQINVLHREMKKVIAAGVRIDGIGSFDATEPFAFAGSLPGRGFGDTLDPLAGGKFATVKRQNDKKFAFDGFNPDNSGFGTVFDPIVGGLFISL